MQSQSVTYSESRMADMMHRAGLRPSAQRIAVFGHIANARTHPDAEEIYMALAAAGRAMSLTTVYNSLHALVGAGLVRMLEIDSTVRRYDFALQPAHSHFICRRCGKVFDMPLPSSLVSGETFTAPGQGTFTIDSAELCLRGTCPHCQE